MRYMGKLLHSKTFRQNLFKWTLMYISVLVIITTVITYSRFISSQTVEDTAKTAKFKVTITALDVCSETSGLCTLSSFKPYDTINYYFKVDTTELEVKSILDVTMHINNKFSFINLNECVCEEDECSSMNEYTCSTGITTTDETQEEDDNTSIKMSHTIILNGVESSSQYRKGIKYYKLGVRFNRDENGATDSTTINNEKVVWIDYHAEQVNE